MNANLQGKASIAIKIALLLCLAVIIAVWRSARGTKEESTLFAGDAAQKAMAETVRMMGSKPRLFSIDIQPTEMIVLVRSADAPNHVDQYRYRTATSYRDWRQLFSRAGVTGPEPTRPVMINPNLEENLFDLAEINLAAVAEASREAARRVALEGGGEVSSIRIQRSVSIVPAPHNGAVEWDITVRGPRESASATADAQGKIRRLDISRTRRAQMLDLTEGGAPLTEAIAEIREHFGAGTVFVSFEVSKSTVSFKIRDSKNPDASLGYYWEINGIYESKALLPLEIRRKMGEVVREDQLFAIDDVDWSRLPELRKIALREAAALEGSITRITRIAVERPSTEAGAKPARWKFNLAAALFEENSTVEFDAKSGELIRLNRPKSLQAAVNYLDPEGSRAAIKAIGQELSRATGFVKILLYQAQASITAVTTEQPDVPREFIYSDRDGIRPFGFANAPNPFHRDFTKDWLFTISELEPVFPLLAELQRKTLDRLRLSDGAVDRITFYRHSVFYPRNRKLLVEVWVENPRRENGRVIYDLQGNVLDVVGGRPVGPVTGKEPAGAANLRPVGITDATPARVAQFDALLASYVALAQKYNDTEWGKLRISDPDNFPNLPQAAFREWRKAQRELLECIKGILKVYAERTPPSDAIASPKAAPYASTRVFWETQHELWHHAQLHSALLDKHWRKFKTHGFPEDEARLSPWQKELNAVQVKIDAAEERIKGLSPPAGTN